MGCVQSAGDLVLPTALTVLVVGVFFGVYGLILSNVVHKQPSAGSFERIGPRLAIGKRYVAACCLIKSDTLAPGVGFEPTRA